MGLVYLLYPRLVDFYGKCIGKYTVRPMDPMQIVDLEFPMETSTHPFGGGVDGPTSTRTFGMTCDSGFQRNPAAPIRRRASKTTHKVFFNPAWQEDGTYMKIYMILYHIVYSLWIMVPQSNWFWLQNAHAFFQVKNKDPPKTGTIIRWFLGLTCCFVGLVFVDPWLYPSFWNKFPNLEKETRGMRTTPGNLGRHQLSVVKWCKMGGFGSRGSEDGIFSGEETSPLRIRIYFGARNIRRKKQTPNLDALCLHHQGNDTMAWTISKARERFRT